jgi:hypothetical protein
MKKSQLKKLIGTVVKEAMSSQNPCQVSCTQGFSPNPANNCACERTSSFRIGSMCECEDGSYAVTCEDCPSSTFKDINPLDADGNPRPMPSGKLGGPFKKPFDVDNIQLKEAVSCVDQFHHEMGLCDANTIDGSAAELACDQGAMSNYKTCRDGGFGGKIGLEFQPITKGSRYSPNNDGEFDPNDPDGQQRMRKGGPFKKPFDVDDLQRETLLLEKPTCAETAQVGFAACDEGDPDDYSGCVQGVFSSYSACKKAAGQSGSFGSNDVKHSLQRNSNPCREGETCATNPACCDGLSQPTRMGEQKSPKHKCCEDAQGNITNASSYPSKKCPKSQTPTACESAKPGGETKDTKKDTMSESFTSKMQRLANISKK